MTRHLFFLSPILISIVCLTPRVGLALIGDTAPPLNVSEWIKGQPVEVKPGTNIYVVEIWQSSDPTSRGAITNLTAIQNRYRTNGVVVVAVSDEPAGKLKPFVDQAGDKIGYAVAADNARYTSLTYMHSVMQRALPYAFVVGTNGILLWHGYPGPGLNQNLDLVTSGTYNFEKAKKVDLVGHQMMQYLNLARQGSDRVDEAGKTLLAAMTNDEQLLCGLAFEISSSPGLQKRDFALAGQALDQAEKLASTNSVGVEVARAIWLFESGKQEQGLLRATQALAGAESPMQASNIQVVINRMHERQAAGISNQNGARRPAAATPGQGVAN